ncbi:hypothetical protein SAMN04487926_10875 [Paraburkholderia steynii]|uniref:Uncharacterized protein n=1 Tax=Paraburkholderia steynii TaxID=1245441 RepID=A0A7Z7B755_9BURK|nr:hypothetical protein SAMN04487926_10875 [Paraburkholderia steynii]
MYPPPWMTARRVKRDTCFPDPQDHGRIERRLEPSPTTPSHRPRRPGVNLLHSRLSTTKPAAVVGAKWRVHPTEQAVGFR